ncbi:hypothetical protein [Nonomuraea sp. C10]|uniref:hypothetical protein n=1 Tax=Nonomuraea sp. C10 TaxID=2600577 RepID=UPI0011CD69D3|nr:hypothetical protein [Nonomuraea sp. C10]TXK41484.1 hypothetical protein FR742_19630 [Nonomuraea sp. C10]
MSRTDAAQPVAPLQEVARCFPLVPRPRAVCRSLEQRVARVRDRAHLAARRGDDALLRAAEAFNVAALIATDCGLPNLAQDLCWQQAGVFLTRRPYPAATAKLALQPLINLGRLLVRDGDPDGAYRVFRGLYDGLRDRASTVVTGREVDLADLVTEEDRPETVQWMRLVLLVDGSRALARAGRWTEALHHAEQHHGVGELLYEGRQVSIIARATAGHHDEAAHLLDSTPIEAPWEEAIAACLRTLCPRLADQLADPVISPMVDAYLRLPAEPEHVVFQVRLGLCVLGLAPGGCGAADVARKMTSTAVASSDAYAAWELLNGAPHAVGDDGPTLTAMVNAAGLGRGDIPDLLDDLQHATRTATEVMRDALAPPG